MPASVCVDASVAVQILTHEDQSQQADALWTDWLRQGLQLGDYSISEASAPG